MTLIRTFAVVGLSLASSALARTDLAGCTYTDLVVKPTQMAAYASRLWYVPDTGEVCEFLDCGGGRAPPKSTVPGCPLYTGTETYAPSYINPKTLGNGANEAGSSSSVAAATTPVLATPSESAAESATASETASATASASGSASASATTASATTDASITILTGINTSTPSKSAESSSAQVTSAASTAGASSSSGSSSSSGAATTTSPSSAAGAMQTVGAVLGPCVVAAIAAGLA